MPKLTTADVDAFLAEPGHLVRIGTIDPDGTPRVVPLWFIIADGRICFTPRATSAVWPNIVRNDRVGLTIDEEAHPYRKIAVQGRATVLHEPGDDDIWRSLYRSIARRYVPADAADAYVDGTIDQPRALCAVSLDPNVSSVSTWRMPVAGEDPTGIWHRRYYLDGTLMAGLADRSADDGRREA